MKKVIEQIRQVAFTDFSSIIIQGETGTGKTTVEMLSLRLLFASSPKCRIYVVYSLML